MPFHPATRGLIWKETRQLMPLVGIVVLVGGIVTVTSAIIAAISPPVTQLSTSILWSLPACFAAGAAALLVGQEKELQTVSWLSGLPSQPSRVIAVKLLVASLGLLGMWLLTTVTFLLWGFLGTEVPEFVIGRQNIWPADYAPEFFVQSFLILGCGFYAAWKMDSIFAGLVLLVPLAIGPFLIQQLFNGIHHQYTGARVVPPGISTAVFFGTSIVWTFGFAYLSVRAAMRYLSPQPAATPAQLDSPRLLDAWRPTVTVVPEQSLRRPLSAFVWQAVAHQRWALMLILVLLVAGAAGMVRLGDGRDRIWELVSVAAASLAISWLGVRAFAGDGAAARLRFLADRGVSPHQAWWGRQIVALSLLSLALLSYFVISWGVLTGTTDENVIASVAMIAVAVCAVYSISQWVSQSIQMLAGSAVIAPIVAVVGLVWGGITVRYFGTSLLVLILTSLIPLLATRVMMRRYMDGARDWRTVAASIFVAMLLFLVPTVPCVVAIVTAPRLSPHRAQQLQAEAAQIEPVPTVKRMPVSTFADDSAIIFLSGRERLQLYQSIEIDPEELFVPLADHLAADDAAVSIDAYRVNLMIKSATHARAKFELAVEDARATERLVNWINSITEWTIRLRRSHQLADQISADLFEIWLLDALQAESIRTLAGIDLATAGQLLGNSDVRHRARRNAVLVSWKRSGDVDAKPGKIRSRDRLFEPPVANSQSQVAWWFTRKNIADLMAATVIDLIDAGSRGESTAAQRLELCRWLERIDCGSPDSPYSDHFREHASLTERYAHWRSTAQSIATLWFAPWEDQARQLAVVLGTQSSAVGEQQQ
jgi:hypothetical protein